MSKPNLLQKLSITGVATAISAIGCGIANLSVQAAIVTSGCAAVNQFCTLQELDNDGTIQVGDKRFSNWDVINAFCSFPALPVPLDLNNIIVSGIFQDTNAPGIEFTSLNNEDKAN